MPNIFHGLRKMSDEKISMQISLFQSVNIGNAVREAGNKAIEKIVGLANMIASSGENKFDYQGRSVTGLAEENLQKLGKMSRFELDKLLKEILTDKCSEFGADPAETPLSEDFLSVMIIREAAKIYSSPTSLPPANMAETIKKKYEAEVHKRLHKILIKETPQQIAATDEKLQKYLDKASIEQKRELNQKINTTEFTGRGIGKLIRKESGIKNITEVTFYLGFEAFDMLSAVIGSVYDVMLGVNKLTRVLFAQLVWASAAAYNGRLSVSKDILPSYISIDKRAEEENQEKQYFLMLKKIDEIKKQDAKLSNEIEKKKTVIEEDKKKLAEEESGYLEAKDNFEKLQTRQAEYKTLSENRKEEAKRYYSEVNLSKERQDHLKMRLDKKEKQIKTKQKELEEKETRQQDSQKELDAIYKKTEILTEQKSKQIKLRWMAFFFRLTFKEEVFKSVVENFINSEILEIEAYLKEMHDSTDINAYKIKAAETQNESEKNVNRTLCLVSAGKNAEILYYNTEIIMIRKQ